MMAGLECDGPIAHAIEVGGSPAPLKSLNRYFLTCDCAPSHYVEVSRSAFRRARAAGVPLSCETIHPWKGTRRIMTLDRWLRPRRRRQMSDTGKAPRQGRPNKKQRGSEK